MGMFLQEYCDLFNCGKGKVLRSNASVQVCTAQTCKESLCCTRLFSPQKYCRNSCLCMCACVCRSRLALQLVNPGCALGKRIRFLQFWAVCMRLFLFIRVLQFVHWLCSKEQGAHRPSGDHRGQFGKRLLRWFAFAYHNSFRSWFLVMTFPAFFKPSIAALGHAVVDVGPLSFPTPAPPSAMVVCARTNSAAQVFPPTEAFVTLLWIFSKAFCLKPLFSSLSLYTHQSTAARIPHVPQATWC